MTFDPNDENLKAIWNGLVSCAKSNDKGCLIFTGRAQYPYVHMDQMNQMRIHDFSYCLHIGEIPEGKKVDFCSIDKLCFISTHLTLKTGKKALNQDDYNKRRWDLIVANSETNEQGCLLYSGKKRECGGYGEIGLRDGTKIQTHIFSWLYHKGKIPAGMVVRHNCKQGNPIWKNNPSCSIVDHLSLGTYADNTADSRRDGTMCVGEDSNLSKLTNSEVIEIFAARNEKTAVERAKKYGVSRKTIANIDNGRSWIHVTGKPSDVYRRPQKNTTSYEYERAWAWIQSHSTRRGKFQCLIPFGALKDGYKRIYFNGRTNRNSHVVVAELFGNDCRKSNLYVRHVVCNDRECSEPSHLDFGSNSDNSKDTAMFSDDAKTALKIFETKDLMTVKERSIFHNVSETQIKNCDSGLSWGWLKDRFEEQKVREKNAQHIIAMRERGVNIMKLSSKRLYDEDAEILHQEIEIDIPDFSEEPCCAQVHKKIKTT